MLYKITRKASPPATGGSTPKVASATRARDTEDQGLINGGGNGSLWRFTIDLPMASGLIVGSPKPVAEMSSRCR
ncbi:hypothetical protein H5407_06130 [Mitsuaria sp. WAJ17]|uniref:hypothetical protein n=1 Tax=Mitsuaria sp. WAJ17 TaxID=2761452 RepID=UPI001600D336|nr:hypothetical protein [Mitsuaria sp. WAJ17]MBB2484803.1 hypothetical protein [Mitsuaria sp. WAJ17]